LEFRIGIGEEVRLKMFSIKDLARSILRKEITTMKDDLEYRKKRNAELQEEVEMLRSGSKALRNESDKIELKKACIQRELDKVKKENEILRKYYDLDKEPSDEIKLKIHIDLELNRVKEENLKMIALLKLPTFITQPYPGCIPSLGRF
jgi:predicted  nucleic acid-binding Zn-ribbon protein